MSGSLVWVQVCRNRPPDQPDRDGKGRHLGPISWTLSSKVEQSAHNTEVVGSNPSGSIWRSYMAAVEQMAIGDIVQLKSGGPKMVVIRHRQDDKDSLTFCCQWWNESAAKYDEADFISRALKKVK